MFRREPFRVFLFSACASAPKRLDQARRPGLEPVEHVPVPEEEPDDAGEILGGPISVDVSLRGAQMPTEGERRKDARIVDRDLGVGLSSHSERGRLVGQVDQQPAFGEGSEAAANEPLGDAVDEAS
jgi:hypothetical protein